MNDNPCVRSRFGFINSLSDGIILFKNSRIVDINQAMLNFVEGKRDSYLGCDLGKYILTLGDRLGVFDLINGQNGERLFGKFVNPSGLAADIEYTVSWFDDDIYMLAANKRQNQSSGKDLFKWILGVSVEGVIIHDENEKIIYANNAIGKMLGEEDCKNLIGTNLFDVAAFHPDYVDEIYKRKEDLFNDDTVLPYLEQKIINKDGVELTVEVSALSYTENGEKRIVLITRDITEKRKSDEDRRKLEETLEYDRLRTDFFSNISHELRTPLNIILVTLQLIDSQHNDTGKCDFYNSTFNGYFKMMKQNCYRLLRLINNIIDITSLDTGFFNIVPENNDIVSVVEDVVMSVADYIKSQEVSIIFDTDIEEKLMAFDPDKIERVILNLLSNAIKFNKSGGIIYVNIYDKQKTIIISVKDCGVGIPENMKEKIFERFTQVDNLFTRVAEGSGIGLSLVKSLVEAHGGSIRVESKVGEGSEFIIELPVKLVEDNLAVNNNRFENQDKIERINIEFSDIYSL